MNIKKKNFALIILLTIAGTLLLACGIFATVSKSVSFNLALVTKPNVYFALTITHVNDNAVGVDANKTGFLIFDNRATNAGSVVSWATVNQNCIVLNQVMAGANMPDITPGTTITLKVTNYTNETGKYLHLGVNYPAGTYQDFTMNNSYGVANLAYNSSASFVITTQNILANTYVQIPFLAEIDETRYTATITTENCEIVSAPRTFKLSNAYTAEFKAPNLYKPIFNYTIKINGSNYNPKTTSAELNIPSNALTGNIVITVNAIRNPAWDGTRANSFNGGDGATIDTPFLIATAEQLALMQYLVANYNDKTTYIAGGITTTCSLTFGKGYYKLINDIVLNENYENYKQWEDFPPANNWTPISVFYGNFQGNNHTVYGMYINSNKENLGLFGLIAGATLSEICVNHSIITGNGWHIGGIAGKALNATTTNFILNCAVNNSMFKGTYGIGGIYGGESDKPNNYIANCTNFANLYALGMYEAGGSDVGGIAALGATIINCVNYGNICGYGTNLGGIGSYNVHCYNSYTIGNLTTFTTEGLDPIFGREGGSDENCYYLSKELIDDDERAMQGTLMQNIGNNEEALINKLNNYLPVLSQNKNLPSIAFRMWSIKVISIGSKEAYTHFPHLSDEYYTAE